MIPLDQNYCSRDCISLFSPKMVDLCERWAPEMEPSFDTLRVVFDKLFAQFQTKNRIYAVTMMSPLTIAKILRQIKYKVPEELSYDHVSDE